MDMCKSLISAATGLVMMVTGGSAVQAQVDLSTYADAEGFLETNRQSE